MKNDCCRTEQARPQAMSFGLPVMEQGNHQRGGCYKPDCMAPARITSYNVCYTKLLRNAGFETGQSFGIAFRDIVLPEKEEDDPAMNAVLVLPVKDSAKASETIRKFLEKASPGIIFSQKSYNFV